MGIVGISSEKMVRSRSFDLSSFQWYIWMLVAVMSKAIASLFAQRHLSQVPVLWSAWGQTVLGACVTFFSAMIGDYALEPYPFDFTNVEPSAVWGLVYLGVFSSCFVYILQYWLIVRLGSVRQMFVDFMVPLVGLVEGVLILDEWKGEHTNVILLQLGGCAFIFVALSLLLKNENPDEEFLINSGVAFPTTPTHSHSASLLPRYAVDSPAPPPFTKRLSFHPPL